MDPALLAAPRRWSPGRSALPHWIWSSGVAAYAVLLAVGSLAPVPFDEPLSLGHLDKVIHLCEYWVLAWLLIRTIPRDGGGGVSHRMEVWMLAVGYGGLLEIAQTLIPWRSGDVADLAANALGAALGLWIGPRHR